MNKIETLESTLIDKSDDIRALQARVYAIENKVNLNEYKIGDIKKGSAYFEKEVRTSNGKVEVNIDNAKGGK